MQPLAVQVLLFTFYLFQTSHATSVPFFSKQSGTLRNKTVKLHHLDSFRENSPRLRQFHLTQLPGIHQELEEANAMPSQRARGSGCFQVQTCCTFQGATGPTSPPTL